jgi:hypothetical protein
MIARMIAAGANTSLLVALLALQSHQFFLVGGFQAPAVRNGRRVSAVSTSVLGMAQPQEQQRQSAMTSVEAAMDHTPVVPQDTSPSSSSSMQIATSSSSSIKDNVLDTKVAAVAEDDENREKDPTKKMLQQIKDSGLAGAFCVLCIRIAVYHHIVGLLFVDDLCILTHTLTAMINA